MQLADKLEAKRALVKADWDCWKKLEEQFKKIMDSSHLICMTATRSNLVGTRAQEREMQYRHLTNGKGDGYIALLFFSLPSTAQVPHQDLCSKGMEGEKENQGRENRKLQCGKRQ